MEQVPEHCCECPRLNWSGSGENAAVVCSACGFILADDGQLVDWHDPEQIAWQSEIDADTKVFDKISLVDISDHVRKQLEVTRLLIDSPPMP